MTQQPVSSSSDDRGRSAALLVYCLFLLSIPSFAIFALFGVVIALGARADAGPLARSHLDDQIRVWFVAFYWAIALGLLWLIGFLLLWILVGILIWWVGALIGFVVMLWFTIKSLFGLLALLDGRAR